MAESKGTLVPVGGGDNIPLVRDRMTIGRKDSCDIRLPFPNVSTVHCELSFDKEGGFWTIQDRNSTNGIKVNGLRQYKKALMPGDVITIAKRRYTIQYQLPSNARMEEILEEDVMSQSLLERAGLEQKPRRRFQDDDDDEPMPME